MSILIAQSAEDVKASGAFHRRADLNSVYLLSARLDRHVDWASLKHPIRVEFHFQPSGSATSNGSAEIRTEFRLRAIDSSVLPKEALLVECVFAAIYDFDAKYKPEKADLEAFQSGNAIFNAWPFFREYAQTNIARMNLPVPPIPFLRLVPKIESENLNADPKRAPAKKRQRAQEPATS